MAIYSVTVGIDDKGNLVVQEVYEVPTGNNASDIRTALGDDPYRHVSHAPLALDGLEAHLLTNNLLDGLESGRHLFVYDPRSKEDFQAFLNPVVHQSHPIVVPPGKKEHFSLLKFFTNPNTWAVAALALVGIAILAPPVAVTGLMVGALVAAAATVIAAFPNAVHYARELGKKYPGESLLNAGLKKLKHWFENHGVQFAMVALAVALLITATVLTGGFFAAGGAVAFAGGALIASGGGAFAFMAPVFAAVGTVLAAPFLAAATAAGVVLTDAVLAALVGATLVLTTLAVTHGFTRFAEWLDTFRSRIDDNIFKLYEGDAESSMQVISDESILAQPLVVNEEAQQQLQNVAADGRNQGPLSYVCGVGAGIGKEFKATFGTLFTTVQQASIKASTNKLDDYVILEQDNNEGIPLNVKKHQ